jgi:hypothetical protein
MEISLYKSPFYLLEVSPRDTSEYIIDQVETLSLIKDQDECLDMQNQLLNLNSRLKYEMEWLPGVEPSKIMSLIEALKLNSPHVFNKELPLAQANLVISYLELNIDKLTDKDSIDAIIILGNLTDKFKAKEIQEIINKDRKLSKFPEIKDCNQIENELGQRKQAFIRSLEFFLNTLESASLLKIVTSVIEQATNNGSSYAPDLIYRFIERYNLLTESILESEVIKINDLISKIKDKYQKDDLQINKEINQLVNMVTNWDYIAQPSQLAAQSQEIEHKVSKDLANSLRNLGVHLFNINNLSKIPEEINKLISDVFKELPQVFAAAAEDNIQIKKISADQRKINRQNEQVVEENLQRMKYEAEWGIFDTQNLEISNKFIIFNGTKLLWKNITAFKVGGIIEQNAGHTATSILSLGIVNLSEVHLKFSFTTDGANSLQDFQNATSQIFIDVKDDIGREIDKRLYILRNRLTYEILGALEEGKKIPIGAFQYDNKGFYFSKSKYLTWNQISRQKKWDQGMWLIRSRDDKSIINIFTAGADYNMDIFFYFLAVTWENYQGSITESVKTFKGYE